MSTNVVRPGTTSGSRLPSRFLGVAAAGLAVVIALGVVIAVNQGNEVTVIAPAHPMVSDAHRAKAEILAERAAAAAVSPGANIEAYRLEQAGAIGVTQSPGANIEAYRLEQAGAIGVTQSPGANIEQYKLEQAGLTGTPGDTAQEGNLEQRLAHEFVEEQGSGSGTEQDNPLEGRAE